MNLIVKSKLLKASRSERLAAIIRRYLDGRLDERGLENELERLYNRAGEARASRVPVGRVTGVDPIYLQIKDMIVKRFPVRGVEDLRPDQLDSYANTISARAATHERLIEYQRRGTQYVQVVAYLDERTTDICRSMHGRIFEVGPAHESLNTQGQLVQPSSFWEGNHNFSETPTADMSQAWMPPYHYNCRTRVVPFVMPAEPYEAARVKQANLMKLREKDVQAILDFAAKLEFASERQMAEHYREHHEELEVASASQMMAQIRRLTSDPLKQGVIGVSRGDSRTRLLIWGTKAKGGRLECVEYDLDKKRIVGYERRALAEIKRVLREEYEKVVRL